jgi:ABC-type lipoprotein export system ATPase subunit
VEELKMYNKSKKKENRRRAQKVLTNQNKKRKWSILMVTHNNTRSHSTK